MLKSTTTFEIDANESSIQRLAPSDHLQQYEGVAFSSSGKILAVAAAGANAILLFRRNSSGRFEDRPYMRISGPHSDLDFPHDVAFTEAGDREWLAAAQRRGVITFWEKDRAYDNYGPDPSFEIRGLQTELDYTDGIAFVPPNHVFVAACNHTAGSLTFYRRRSVSPLEFGLTPEFVLESPDIAGPDGIAFSHSGAWLAVANHRVHSVSIFRRRNRASMRVSANYDPKPVAVIRDPALGYPHSVAFAHKSDHLVVTNSGANYFNVYAPESYFVKRRWRGRAPAMMKIPFAPDGLFHDINTQNRQEGGPKGVAIHKNTLAVCSPEIGVKIYYCRERLGPRRFF
jgi:6-phosphogluconolactonase (cycloisomerase 2 family)